MADLGMTGLARVAALCAVSLLPGCATQEQPMAVEAEVMGATAGRGDENSFEALPPESATEALGEPDKAQIFPGTGSFVNPNVSPILEPVMFDADGVTINFVGASLASVVDAVMADILRLNYVIDPRVEGTVTVQTKRPLAREHVLSVLETVLGLNGAAIVEADGLYKIVPIDAAPQSAAPIIAGAARQIRGRGFGVRIVPLRFVGADEMKRILEPLSPQGRILRVDEARNLLILAGTREEIDSLLEAVEIFDVDWLAGMSFGLFPLRYGNANDMIQGLDAIFAASGGKQAGQGILRFMPINQLNAILVISQQAAYIEHARTWIERLDQTGDGTDRRIYVYRVQNARAEHLADVLTQIFAGGDEAGVPPVASLAPGLEPVRLASPTAAIETAAEGVEEAAQPAPPPAPTATPAAASDEEGIGFTGQSEFRIIADTERNSLVILATPQEYRMVEASLRKLDTIPLQVLIQATVVEVTLTDDLNYGVRWFFERGNHTLDINNLPAVGGGGLFYSFTTTDFLATLEALASVTDLNIVSSPELLVLDNHTATLQVGDQVPVATRTATSVIDPEAPTVNEIEFRDTGVILRVTPRVNSGGLVTLEIEQEVSDVAPAEEPTVTPTIFRRTIQSTVAVQSGESVALGGLISDTNRNAKSGVPILASIPILGALFSATNIEAERTELLVLLTPTVIHDQRDARLATDEMQRRMGAVESLLRASGVIKIEAPREPATEETDATSAEDAPASTGQ